MMNEKEMYLFLTSAGIRMFPKFKAFHTFSSELNHREKLTYLVLMRAFTRCGIKTQKYFYCLFYRDSEVVNKSLLYLSRDQIDNGDLVRNQLMQINPNRKTVIKKLNLKHEEVTGMYREFRELYREELIRLRIYDNLIYRTSLEKRRIENKK